MLRITNNLKLPHLFLVLIKLPIFHQVEVEERPYLRVSYTQDIEQGIIAVRDNARTTFRLQEQDKH